MIKVIIIDDEELARERVASLLKDNPEFIISAECADGDAAVKEIEKNDPDLLFLDIQMPGMNGFELLENISGKIPEIIFVTAYDEFAIKAFEVNAIGYLLKPFHKEQFEAVLQRAKELIQTKKSKNIDERIISLLSFMDSKNNEKFIERFIVKSRGRIKFVPVDEIEFIKSEGNYIELNTLKDKHLVRESLSSVDEKLNQKFLRIHRSYIIKIDSIKELQTHFNGEYIFIMKSGSKLKSGRNYKESVEYTLLKK
jgi:two-component system, LytTR family, response regulator